MRARNAATAAASVPCLANSACTAADVARTRQPVGFQDRLDGLGHGHRLRPLRQELAIRQQPVKGFKKARIAPIGPAPESVIEIITQRRGAGSAQCLAQRRARVVALSDERAQGLDTPLAPARARAAAPKQWRWTRTGGQWR